MKILILRFSSIGDIVLTTPVIRCVKKQLPNAEVHYATKAGFKEILAHNPYIDKLHLLESELKDLVAELKQEQFDFVIDLHNNIRTAAIKARLRTKNSSFDKLNPHKWLMVNFKINSLPDKHIVDRYLEAAAPLDIVNDHQGLDYLLPDDIKPAKDLLPPPFHGGYLGFVIGAKHKTKKLPPDKIAAVCDELKLPVILLGGPEDHAEAEEVMKLSEAQIYNGCGQFSLSESALLVKEAKVVISHDTGLMHIAAAFKKPVISVWGNTIPEFGMYPYYGTSIKENEHHRIFEIKNLPCRPCSKIGFAQCPKKHFLCMNSHDEVEIAEAVQELWAMTKS